jgi:ATP synthase F1 epsilon subunit
MFRLKVITPTSTVSDTMVLNVTVPTTAGVITILNKHIPLVAPIKHGELIIRTDSDEHGYAVSSGVVHIEPHKDGVSEVVILLEDVEKVDGKDMEMRAQALLRARDLAHEKADELSFGTFESQIERELSKVKFTRRKRL